MVWPTLTAGTCAVPADVPSGNVSKVTVNALVEIAIIAGLKD